MKRRAFLAMLGLAPVAAVAAAKKSPEIDWAAIEGRMIDNFGPTGVYRVPSPVEAKPVTLSWAHPEFTPELLDRPHRVTVAEVPSSDDHCGREVQILDDAGTIIYRQWNRK